MIMAKIKERKSESWKPGVFHDDGFISKNKKRKDKRMSLNLSAKKIDTEEFIPIKKSALAFNKTKDSLTFTPSKLLSPSLVKKHTPKKIDTPLPAFKGKKQASTLTPNARKQSLADTPTAASRKLNGTPKLKFEAAGSPKKAAGTPKAKLVSAGTPKVNLEPVIKSSLKKKAQKFIDNEAEEGEEPVTDKGAKPYVKGQKRKSISFKYDDHDEESDSDDSDEITDAGDFFDNEASEGEETDDSDADESSNDESEDDDDDDGEDSDVMKSFLTGDDEDDESDEEDSDVSDEEGSVEEDDDESDEVSDDSDDEEPPKLLAKKNVDSKIKTKAASALVAPPSKNKKSKVENDSDDDDDKPQPKLKKPDNKITAKPVTAPLAPLNQIKKEKVEKSQKKVNEPLVKKSKVEENVVSKIKKEEKKPKENDASAIATTDYVGYIKYLPSSITVDQIKSQLGTAISPENIVSLKLKKNNVKTSNKCFVYVSDEDSLDKLENKTFTIGKTTFKVFKARESKKVVKTQPLAFLPRVPVSISDEKLKSIIEADIGAGKIIALKSKKENEKLKTRNVLVELTDEEILKKIIYKGSYTFKGNDIIVRQAFESGFQIPVYKIVFSGIPENTTEAFIKKAVEMKVGKGSVATVKFSFFKKSYAFVTLNTEEAQKKLLEPGTEISVQGTKLEVQEFKPRPPPKKRGPAKKKNPDAPASKKQKIDQSSPEPKSKKPKKKRKSPKSNTQPASPAANQPNSPQKKSKPVQNTPQQKKQSLKQSQNSPQKKQKPQQQPGSPSPAAPSKNKKANKAQNQVPDKKANLNKKLEGKKNKLKDKKIKNKQAATSD